MHPREGRFHGVHTFVAVAVSAASLAVPVAALLSPVPISGEYSALLWLLALVPVGILASTSGWHGVAVGLAIGLATLASTVVIQISMGVPRPETLPGVAAAYVAIALAFGWMASCLHRERDEQHDDALVDPLTRLPNRRHALVFLRNEFAAARRGRPLAVVLFDIDNFKRYNDTYDFDAGDEAIRLFASILARTTRQMNLSARYSGEEFVSVIAGSDATGAEAFAGRVRRALEDQGVGSPALTVSAGVAMYHPRIDSPEELLLAADRAVYDAKAAGKNRVGTSHDEPSRPYPTPLDGQRGSPDSGARAVTHSHRASARSVTIPASSSSMKPSDQRL